jgi:hypothetical protein
MTESFTHSGARALALSPSLPLSLPPSPSRSPHPPLSLPLSLSLSGCSRAKMVARCGEEGIRPMSLDILASRSVPRAPPPGAPGGGICVCMCVWSVPRAPPAGAPGGGISLARALSLALSLCVCVPAPVCLPECFYVRGCICATCARACVCACVRAQNDTESGGHCTHCPYRHTGMHIYYIYIYI